jgi:hypothetical protein
MYSWQYCMLTCRCTVGNTVYSHVAVQLAVLFAHLSLYSWQYCLLTCRCTVGNTVYSPVAVQLAIDDNIL